MNAAKVLETMAGHANGKARFAVWKEQARALAIYSEEKLYAKVNYIHANPVSKGTCHPSRAVAILQLAFLRVW